MSDWFTKGEATTHVTVDDRGFQYGDGLFETIAVRNGECRLWPLHIERLTKGCRVLGIDAPSEAELTAGVGRALHQSDVDGTQITVKIIVSAGPGQRGYGRKVGDTPSVLIGVFPASPVAPELYSNGVDTLICKTRLACGSATAGLKTLNRLEQVLARSEFIETDKFEGLTMDADGHIICGTMSNVFFVKDKSISTPPLDQCGVEGVMRKHIIASLQEQGINVAIQTCDEINLGSVDELFLSNSQFGVLPVKNCMQMQYPVGQVTKKVMSILAHNGVSECRL